jgi:hypothetical protein
MKDYNYLCIYIFKLSKSAYWARASSLSRLQNRTHLDTFHLVGLPWKSDQPYAETSTW